MIDDAEEERQRLIAETPMPPIDLQVAIQAAIDWLDSGAPGMARSTLLTALTAHKKWRQKTQSRK